MTVGSEFEGAKPTPPGGRSEARSKGVKKRSKGGRPPPEPPGKSNPGLLRQAYCQLFQFRCIGRFGIIYFLWDVVSHWLTLIAFNRRGRGFDSRSSRHVRILDKSLTHSCLLRFEVKPRHSIRAVGGAFE